MLGLVRLWPGPLALRLAAAILLLNAFFLQLLVRPVPCWSALR